MPKPSDPPGRPDALAPDVELLLNAIPAFVWYKDTKNRIVRCNEAAAASMGKTRAELEGREVGSFYPDEADSYYRDDLDVITSGEAKRGIVERLLTASGEKLWIRTDKIPVRDADGRVVGLIVFAVDITDLKEAERDRMELEQQLQQAQKMEALGRLAGGVAHDLNNFLTPILGLSDLATMGSASHAEQNASLREIHAAAERAAALVSRLLHFGRRQVRSPRKLDLSDTLRRLEPILLRLMREDVRCDIRCGEIPGVVVADPGEIEVVVMNLVANGQDAIAGSGELLLETGFREVPPGDATEHSGVPPGRYATVRVVDSGKGMDSATASRIFEPFFTTRQAGGGTGLGLATVDSIVRQSGGRIVVTSAPGRGTRIEVLLPLVAGEPDVVEPALDAVPLRGQEAVLVVEDQPEVLALIELILTRYGYDVHTASGAGEALRIARNPDTHLDLLLCDVVLADESGLALAQRLRGDRPELPVLWTSGYAADVLEAHGVTGPIDLLQKPFSATELVARVRRALERHARTASLRSPSAAGSR